MTKCFIRLETRSIEVQNVPPGRCFFYDGEVYQFLDISPYQGTCFCRCLSDLAVYDFKLHILVNLIEKAEKVEREV